MEQAGDQHRDARIARQRRGDWRAVVGERELDPAKKIGSEIKPDEGMHAKAGYRQEQETGCPDCIARRT